MVFHYLRFILNFKSFTLLECLSLKCFICSITEKWDQLFSSTFAYFM